MSASEIELTFIRCSSCKSLMPSTASRCGMCGMDLMNSAASSSNSSTSNSSISKVIEPQQTQKQFPKDEVTQQYNRPSSANDNYSTDKYIEDNLEPNEQLDYEREEKSNTGADYRLQDRNSVTPNNTRQEKKSAVLSFAKEMKVLNQKASRTDLAEEKKSNTQFNTVKNTEELKNNFLDQFDEPEDDFLNNDLNDEFILGDESEQPSDNISGREEATNNYQEPRPLKKKKRKRKKKRVLPLEESVRSDDLKSREVLSEEPRATESRSSESRYPEQRERPATGFRFDRNIENNRSEQLNNAARLDSNVKLEVPKEEKREREVYIEAKAENRNDQIVEREVEKNSAEKHSVQRRATNDHIRENLREKGPSKVMSNKLIGWFVSYGIELTGKAFEIREGRKFIGRQQLRSFDLVIPDSAVSTPHCLLQVDEHGVHLQDLMSDQGTFIKKPGEREFRKIESSVVLKHGDVLKLGSFELVVCLIPE